MCTKRISVHVLCCLLRMVCALSSAHPKSSCAHPMCRSRDNSCVIAHDQAMRTWRVRRKHISCLENAQHTCIMNVHPTPCNFRGVRTAEVRKFFQCANRTYITNVVVVESGGAAFLINGSKLA